VRRTEPFTVGGRAARARLRIWSAREVAQPFRAAPRPLAGL